MKQLASMFVLGALTLAPVLPAGADQGATVVRVFQLKYKSAADASTLIQPLLSDNGSVTVQPQKAVLTVQDQPEVLERVVATLKQFDRAPEPYRVRVQLLEASNGPLPEGVKSVQVDQRVRTMFHFDSYRSLASTEVTGTVGHSASVQLGSAYSLTFDVLEPPAISPRLAGRRVPSSQRSAAQGAASTAGAQDRRGPAPATQGFFHSQRIILREIKLWKKAASDDPSGKLQEVLSSNAFMAPGQKVVLGAGASEGSPTALVLMLEAEAAVEQ